MFGLYHAFNKSPVRRCAIKIYWWLFRNSRLVRGRFLVPAPDNEFPFSRIMGMMPKGSVVSFNLGTPGPEQKISMLGLDGAGKHFFAKYSDKVTAMELSRNEVKALNCLKNTGLAPELLEYRDEKDFVFFRTSCVAGSHPENIELNGSIFNLLLSINDNNVKDGDLKTCLCHGDFTPWNTMVCADGSCRMIDWELSSEYEVGYDLFTYIIHAGTLLRPDISARDLIDANKKYVDAYFSHYGISDSTPYLKAYARRRIAYDRGKGELEHAKIFETLL